MSHTHNSYFQTFMYYTFKNKNKEYIAWFALRTNFTNAEKHNTNVLKKNVGIERN